MSNETATERAFRLAYSGTCTSVADIERRLKAEHYENYHLEGRALRTSLRSLIKAAQATTSN